MSTAPDPIVVTAHPVDGVPGMDRHLDQHGLPRYITRHVAADTIAGINARAAALLAHDRRMVIASGYLHVPDPAATRWTVGTRPDFAWGNPIRTTDRSWWVSLTRGTGFGWDTLDWDTHDEAARALPDIADGTLGRRDLYTVTINGWGTEPCRDDDIEIRHLNIHGVTTWTRVVFQADWD